MSDPRDVLAAEAVDAAADAALAASDALFDAVIELRRDSWTASLYGWSAVGGERWRSLVAVVEVGASAVAELVEAMSRVRGWTDRRFVVAERIRRALAVMEEKKRAALLLPTPTE